MNKPFDSTLRLRAQVSILKDVVKDYPHRTIENVIQNIESRIKTIEEYERRERGLP